MSRDGLTFGWFLPTSGDTTCLGDPAARIPQSSSVFDEIVEAVDNGGFKYLLMPVNATCWEATCLLYTSPSPRDRTRSRMPSSA